jgi:release factor family 11
VTFHTDIPTHTDVERLLSARNGPCVSIYLPSSPITVEANAARIELKTLAATAGEQLQAAGADRATVVELGESLTDLVEDNDFWEEQSHSLAVFASDAGLRTFRLPNRLTSEVEVGDRFYVKPLLRAVTFPQAAFVLALSGGAVRLVEIAREGPAFTVDVPGLPSDAASAAGKSSIADRSPSRRLQGSEGQKVLLRQFARKVDHALRGVLTGLEVPLILAAAEPLDSIYRSLNSYPHLVEAGIPGNPDAATDEELAASARRVLDDVYAAELAALGERFEFEASRARASTDVATIAHAATRGAVDTLFVDIDDKVIGTVDDESGAVTFAGTDDAVSYGVVDEIARRVLLTGGDVLAVRASDVPGGGPAAAILRYAL